MGRVYTEDICGRCGRTERQDGAEMDCPLIGWSDLRLTRRDKGSGWTNHTRLASTHLCPNCAEAVRRFVETERLSTRLDKARQLLEGEREQAQQ